MRDEQERVLSAMADGFKTQFAVLEEGRGASELDSWIKPDRVDEVTSVLDEAIMETPKFLRGVLLTDRQANEIVDLLMDIRRDLEWGAKFQHAMNTDHKAGQAMIGSMLSSLLGQT